MKPESKETTRTLILNLVISGAILASRKVPEWYRKYKEKGKVYVEISDDKVLAAVQKYLASQDMDTSRFEAKSYWSDPVFPVHDSRGGKNEVYVFPKVETLDFKFEGNVLQLSLDTLSKTVMRNGKSLSFDLERYQISGKDRSVIRRFIQHAMDRDKPEEKQVFELGHYGDWHSVIESEGRKLETVILKEGLTELLTSDLEQFRQDRRWYAMTGQPYRRTYLLYGPPGTGKSSIASALATRFHMPIYVINLNSGISDGDLSLAFRSVRRGSVILIEDIDAAFEGRETKEGKLSFSGLLNAIDGVSAQEGSIIIMTTNHPEKLDDALLRDGRSDVKLYIGPADRDQIRRMFLLFYPGQMERASMFADALPENEIPPATLRNHFVKYRNNPVYALSNVKEILATPDLKGGYKEYEGERTYQDDLLGKRERGGTPLRLAG